MAEAVFKKSTVREYFESLVITVILALFGTTFIVQAFKIPTPSMEDNLLVGDHLLVNKFVYGARGSFLDAVLPLTRGRPRLTGARFAHSDDKLSRRVSHETHDSLHQPALQRSLCLPARQA